MHVYTYLLTNDPVTRILLGHALDIKHFCEIKRCSHEIELKKLKKKKAPLQGKLR